MLGKLIGQLPVRVPLPPIGKARDLIDATAMIAQAAADGDISTSDATALGSIVGNVAKAIELHELAARIERLETAQEKR